MAASRPVLDVALERGGTRTFAMAVAWPGWERSVRGRAGDEAALEALLAYAPRYAEVARRAGLAPVDRPEVRIVAEVAGTPTTDFGAPDAVLDLDAPSAGAAARRDLERRVALLRSAWDLFDEVAAAAPEELAKGPRGGGRDTSAIVRHVVEAERAYARKVGVRHRPFEPTDLGARDSMRAALVGALLADEPGTAWPARYAVRRTAWHVLDHLWEIQDKS